MSGPTERVDRECVEGYVFVAEPLELLALRRPPDRGRYWVPVSGKVEPADADFESALRRELREETGLADPRRIVPLDWHVPFRAPNGERWRLHGYAVEVPGRFTPRLSAEHEAFAWVDPAEAIRRFHYADNREAVRRLVSVLRAGRGNA